METLDIVPEVKLKAYVLVKADYYVQLFLFWGVVLCAATVVGIFFAMLLMVPWGAIQIVSALYNTYRLRSHRYYQQSYTIYWAMVLGVILIFFLAYLSFYAQASFIAAMLLSAVAGCYHTYIIHKIYKGLK